MARNKKFNSSLYLRELTGDNWFLFYRRNLETLLWQMFEWKGLPETINPFFLERVLHTQGQIAFYDDAMLGKIAVQGTPMYLNPYGEPIDYKGAMYNYTKSFTLKTYLDSMEQAKKDNLGILCHNQLGQMVSSQQSVIVYAGLLADNKQTKLIAQNTLKIPYVFKGTEAQSLMFKNIFERIQANDPMFIFDKENDPLEDFEILNTNAPYILDKLEVDRMTIYNEFLTEFGINNLNINKKERTNLSEVNANNELILHNRNRFLAPRKEVARILSEMWGLHITVDIREDVQKEKFSVGNKEGVENG